MSFLFTAQTMLSNDESITIKLTKDANNLLSVIVIPHFDANENETDESVAVMRSALSMPIAITIPQDFNPDVYFMSIIGQAHARRASVKSELESYLQTMKEAEEQMKAKAAEQRKAKIAESNKSKATKDASKASRPTGLKKPIDSEQSTLPADADADADADVSASPNGGDAQTANSEVSDLFNEATP